MNIFRLSVLAMLTCLFLGAGCSCVRVEITVTPNPAAVQAGQTVTLTAVSTDSNDSEFDWSSSDESVATVDAWGVVTGVSGGQATITATGRGSGASGSAEVVVSGGEEGEGEGILEGEGAEEGEGAQEGEGGAEGEGEGAGPGRDDLVFIHHSCGENWLANSLEMALQAKPYLDERNDITYGTDLNPDAGRPDSLAQTPGDLTDMHHWILWFNDYLQGVKSFDCADGINRIIMFKSCFPNSHIDDDGAEPGNPFDEWRTLANYRAVYRHPGGAGNTYQHGGRTYRALEDVFAANPQTLFIPITAPPECWNDTDVTIARRARTFNNWLKNTWLPGYIGATGLHNVAVFDFFDAVAYADSAATHPNQLRQEYGGNSGDSHPNDAANAHLTQLFASGGGNFLDQAWGVFGAELEGEGEGGEEGEGVAEGGPEGWPEGGAEGQIEGTAEGEGQPEGGTEGEGAAEGEGTGEGEPEGGVEGEGEGMPEEVAITVLERAGAQRAEEYVSFGIPLPRQWNVISPDALRLRDLAKAPIPGQFEVLARWGGAPSDTTRPIKWVLVGGRVSVTANGSTVLYVDRSGPGPAPVQPVVVDTGTPGKMIVNTGAAEFELNTGADFNLFHQVRIGGQDLLAPLSATEAIHYAPADSLGIVGGGSPDFTPRVTQAVVERAGPLSTIVRVTGSVLDAGTRALLDFTARLHFVAGHADVRVDFTVENNQPMLETGDGQPANAHAQGAVNSVYIGDLTLCVQLRDTGAEMRAATEQEVSVASLPAPLRLYQDSSGTDAWNHYVGPVGWPGSETSAHPRLQSYCTLPGYTISGGGLAASLAGQQALGWMSAARVGGSAPGIAVAVRDFWENFPKSLEVDPEGTVGVGLFPNGAQFRHNLRIGEEKTHSVLFAFALSMPSASEAERRALAFDNPLFGAASPSWYMNSGALGEAPAVDLNRWPLYERYARTAFDANPDFNPSVDDPSFGNRTLKEIIRQYNFYGWQDYGDVPLDYEAFGPAQAGQMNLKYWYLYGMLLQFCRSADTNWLDLGRAGAWHLADIDFLHIPDEGAGHWAHGAYFGHSQHDEPGNTNPNRNHNSPSVDLFFGVPDLLLAYYLLGEVRFRDVAMEGVEAMQAESQFSDFSNPVFYRERANLIFAYIEAYRQTGEARWLTALREIVAPTAVTSNKPWLVNPNTYRPGGEERFSDFQFAQVIWTLGKYLDFCNEYGLADDLDVGAALVRYGDFVIEQLLNEYAPGRAAVIDSIWFFDPGYETFLEINNWALTMADALAYAHKYSGEARFMAEAAKFYATGTIDPQWQGDPPVYIDAKGLVNSLNWGLVYMNQQNR